MATPKPTASAEDLTKCGICKDTINEPKALPCLHTFCLMCLREWVASEAKCTSVVCPACKKTTPLPADGVDGLPGNIFVSSLMERSRTLTPVNVACVCCEEKGSTLLARCLTCDGFLCEKGVETHQNMKFLRNHKVINLDDLRCGKVNLRSIIAKQPTCDKHKGQPLWFFCETCSVLVCRDCTVVNHKIPDHAYVEMESAIMEQKREIIQLVEESRVTSQLVSGALQTTRSMRTTLDGETKQATLDIEKTEELAIRQIRNICKAEKERLDKHVSSTYSKIDVTEDCLLGQQSQLKRAQEMASQVLNAGSDYDVASMYQQLNKSLQEVSRIQPSHERGLYRVGFKAAPAISANIKPLGTLTLGVKNVSSGKWVLQHEINGQKESEQMTCPSGIAITTTGDIAVASNDESTPVHVYSCDACYKFSLDERSRNALNLAVASNGNMYVTTDSCKNVMVYDVKGQYCCEFPSVPPANDIDNGVQRLDNEDKAVPIKLRGLAFSKFIGIAGQVLVGELGGKYISIHDVNGEHVTSFGVPVNPYFLAVTNDNYIIVSAREEDTRVCLLDFRGNHVLAINAPDDVSTWYPCGICVSINNEICIANYSSCDKGIHCFSVSGEYLGCICDQTESPDAISLMAHDEKMAVVELYNDDTGHVKLFEICNEEPNSL